MLQDDPRYGHEAVSRSTSISPIRPRRAAREELRKTLGRDDLRVAQWLGLNARFVGALQVERVMMFIILTLIVVVAAMNVVASFTMLVRVKRGQHRHPAQPWGPHMAPSCAPSSVGRRGRSGRHGGRQPAGLLVCANMHGIARLLLLLTNAGGPGAGWSEVEFITSARSASSQPEVLSIIAIAILLSLAAAAYPAWRSTRVEPVEGLRHE